MGLHGAGLTNILYMKPHGVVVEIVPYFDSRHAPLTGIFPRLSGLIGLHHYSYQIEDQRPERDIHPENLATDTSIFVNKLFAPGSSLELVHNPEEDVLKSEEFIKLKEELKEKEKLIKSHQSDSLGIDYGG